MPALIRRYIKTSFVFLLVAAGGLGQLVAAALFVVNMWWRVRMPAAAPPR